MEYNYNNLIVEVENKIALVTLNRPQALNALNKDLLDDISNFFTDADSDPAIRVIILTGSGEKSFVAGADIKEFANFDGRQGEQLAAKGQENVFDKILEILIKTEIDFKDDKEFSNRFYVLADDEYNAKQFLNSKVRKNFNSIPKKENFTIEIFNNELIISNKKTFNKINFNQIINFLKNNF